MSGTRDGRCVPGHVFRTRKPNWKKQRVCFHYLSPLVLIILPSPPPSFLYFPLPLFLLFFTSLPAFYQYLSPPLPSSVLLLSVFALLFIFLSLYKEMFPPFSSSLLHLIHLTGVCSLALGLSLSLAVKCLETTLVIS